MNPDKLWCTNFFKLSLRNPPWYEFSLAGVWDFLFLEQTFPFKIHDRLRRRPRQHPGACAIMKSDAKLIANLFFGLGFRVAKLVDRL